MKWAMKYLIVLAAVIVSGCGASSTAPAPLPIAPVAAPRLTPTLPIVVAGQSNAVFETPYLQAVYPLPVFAASAQSGLGISYWGPLTAPQVMWPLLASDVRRSLQALVWWQGESDRGNPRYLDDLRELIAKARAENGNLNLLIVEVRVLDLPINASVRAAQETFAQTDRNAVLVSSDGFQDGMSDHLTAAGYQTVADRILAALR
jgi:hypothetical protein